MKKLRETVFINSLITRWLYRLRLVIHLKSHFALSFQVEWRRQNISVSTAVEHFSFQNMATLRHKRKLAAVARKTQKQPRNGQTRNKSAPRINEEYIRQVSEEIEGRFIKKASQELTRTASRIMGALSKLDELILKTQVRGHSENVTRTFRDTNVENNEPNEVRFQDDPHLEVGSSVRQSRL